MKRGAVAVARRPGGGSKRCLDPPARLSLSAGSVARSSKGANKSFTDSSITRLRFLIRPYLSRVLLTPLTLARPGSLPPDSLTGSDIVSTLADGAASARRRLPQLAEGCGDAD